MHPRGVTFCRGHPRETQAFQASKLLSTRAAPQRTTPFVRSSSSSRTARPLSQPLRGAPDGNPASPSPSPWAEARRRLIRSVGRRLLAIAAVGELQLQHARVGSTGGRAWAHTCTHWCQGKNPGRPPDPGRHGKTEADGVIQGLHTVCNLAIGASDHGPAHPSTDSRPPLSCPRVPYNEPHALTPTPAASLCRSHSNQPLTLPQMPLPHRQARSCHDSGPPLIFITVCRCFPAPDVLPPGIFCTVYPPPLFDTPLLHILVAVFLCDLVMGD